MIDCTLCPYIALGPIDLTGHLKAGHGFSQERAEAEARRMQEDTTKVSLQEQPERGVEETRWGAIKARLQNATPGPWDIENDSASGKDEFYGYWHRVGPFELLGKEAGADSVFIAHAPTDIVFLLEQLTSALASLEASNRALTLAMADVEKLREALMKTTNTLDPKSNLALFNRSLLSSAHPGREGGGS